MSTSSCPQPLISEALAAPDEFAYIVAHMLDAPLRSIARFSQSLEETCHDDLNEQARHYIGQISEHSRQAQARIAGLLQYSRLHSVPLALRNIDSMAVINSCLQELRDDIEDREALIHVGPMPNVVADSERLSLLFYCLFSNALKFCRERPDIAIAARRGHKAWAFSVRDRGIGIAPEDCESIFDIFQRLHSDDQYPGTGVGLALAKRIAELHGGIIWAEPAPVRGTVFHFSIPDRTAVADII